MASGQSMDAMMQEFEMAATAEMFTNIVDLCLKKCINTTYKDADLSKAEAVCVDRCQSKFFEFYETSVKSIAARMRTQQEQQQATAGRQ
eukprot:m.127011 g.127011  ORF g.127011 m.127011 type:complete len:89 (+) comp16352_c0_seq5:28-294(+)